MDEFSKNTVGPDEPVVGSPEYPVGTGSTDPSALVHCAVHGRPRGEDLVGSDKPTTQCRTIRPKEPDYPTRVKATSEQDSGDCSESMLEG